MSDIIIPKSTHIGAPAFIRTLTTRDRVICPYCNRGFDYYTKIRRGSNLKYEGLDKPKTCNNGACGKTFMCRPVTQIVGVRLEDLQKR
jgi:hypothetical protein